MHYYQFNIGDYKSHTDYLTPIEDLAYRRMLDLYYLHEKPLPATAKEVARKIGLRENVAEVELILNDFFDKSEDGYVNYRANEEIDAYKLKAEVAKNNGKRGGRPSKKTQQEPKITQPVNSANPVETGSKAKHKPLNINQEPLTIKQVKEKDLSPKVDVSLIHDVFEYWLMVMNKSSRTSLTTLRKTKIASRLKDGYPVHEIKQAIDNVSKDHFLVAGGHTDIEMICRSDTNLEKYRDAMPNNGQLSQTTMQNIETFRNVELD